MKSSTLIDGRRREDWHVHACRVFTAKDEYLRHQVSLAAIRRAPLETKQRAVGILHELETGVLGPAYTKKCLTERMERLLQAKIEANEGEVHFITDVSDDAVGTIAFDVARELKEKYKDQITIYVYAYPIFGLNPKYPGRLEMLEKAAPNADGVMGLAERDMNNSLKPYGHTREVLRIAKEHGIVAQFHVGQENSPFQHDTEELIQAVKWLGPPKVERLPDDEPTVWAVHAISLTCSPEEEFWQIVDDLLEYNIGVIVCGYAAISNRQRRQENAPIHNPITRVLELAYAGVPIRLGTDNVNDIFMVTPKHMPYSATLQRELDLIPSELRYEVEGFWEKIARGVRLNAVDRQELGQEIEDNYRFWGYDTRVLKKYLS